MFSESVICMLTWDENWNTIQGKSEYIGGQSKLFRISRGITLHNVKEKIYHSLGVDSKSYDLQLSMQSAYGVNKNVLGRVAPIQDDDELMCFLDYCRMNPSDAIPLYVNSILRKEDGGKAILSKGKMKIQEEMTPPPKVVSLQSCAHRTHKSEDSATVEYLPGLDDLTENQVFNIVVDVENFDSEPTDFYDGNDDDGTHGNGNELENQLFITPKSVSSCEQPSNDVHNSVKLADHELEKKRIMNDLFRWLPEAAPPPALAIENGPDKGVFSLSVNDIFTNKAELQDALGKHAILNHYQWFVHRSNKTLFEVRCIDTEKCKWRAKGTAINNSELFLLRRIDSMDLHRCPKAQVLPHHRQAGKRVAGSLIRENFDMAGEVDRPAKIAFNFGNDHDIHISYMQAWRAKQWAIEAQSGSPEQSYMFLPDYCETLKAKNPGTVVHIETDDGDHFKCLFFAIGASIRAFKEHLRPILCIDGTFLKGKYTGTLLAVVAKDGNNQIFPLAFAICHGENNETWTWFLERLKECIGEVEDLAIISDRHKSIEHALNKIFPNSVHGICAFHLQQNVKAKFKKVKNIHLVFWKVAKAYRVSDFEERFDKLCRLYPEAGEYIREAGVHKWSRAHFSTRRDNIMTTNNSESFNAALGIGRSLPITLLLEYIRSLLQKWSHERRTKAGERDAVLSEWAEAKLEGLAKTTKFLSESLASYIKREAKKKRELEKELKVEKKKKIKYVAV